MMLPRCAALSPVERRLFASVCALAKIHVHQVLVGNSRFASQVFEVIDRVRLDTNGDLLLEATRVTIALRFAEIVLSSRGKNSSYCLRSRFVALRAEISRIISSSDR
jgi:hypothetical protein